MNTPASTLPALLLLTACAATRDEPSAPASAEAHVRPWQAPPLERAVSVRDGRTGAELSFARLLDELAEVDAVFLGETHTDETTHRVELAVYEGLLERRAGRVVLALEMFERDAQGALDDYLSGEIDEATFLERSRPWSNYRTAYRPLVERARAARRPVVASNFPTPVRRRMASEGAGVLEDVRREHPELVPRRLEPNRDEYWRRVDNAVRGHLEMMGGANQSPEERLYSTQSLWDNSMGEACADALEQHPGHAVVHVNGGFHSAYWDGTVHQLALRSPGARIATVTILPTSNPAVADVGEPASADYVVYAEARATDRNDGRWSVYVPREIEYALHLPEGAAENGASLPLLLWLGDDGLSAEDGLALWRARLGAECAIAVLEPPYRELQEDLAPGGRWFWTGSFSSDVSAMATALERCASYLARHFPVDPERICVAGEGTGATVAAAVALLSDRLGLACVAFEPTRYAEVRDLPLPLPGLRGSRARPASLGLLPTAGAARDWWREEVEQYAGAELDAHLLPPAPDPWVAARHREDLLRASLGLEARSEPTPQRPAGTPGQRARRHIFAARGRATFWARLHALDHTARTGEPVAVLPVSPVGGEGGAGGGAGEVLGSQELSLAIGPHSFSDGRVPPRCPGPFGGTTMLVVPDGVEGEVLDDWLALEAEDPLAAESRFHRTRIATLGGERDLPEVLARLAGEGRRNVLVVPATFCADGARMRELRRATEHLDDELSLHWRPGLGGLD